MIRLKGWKQKVDLMIKTAIAESRNCPKGFLVVLNVVGYILIILVNPFL